MSAVVKNVIRSSLADKNGIKPGDVLRAINGRELIDILDFLYQTANEKITLEVNDKTVVIENPGCEPLGIEFERTLIDQPKSCQNKCIFCFIDQLPENMRPTCYFKDDDYRLSVLQGNYITLTNLSRTDIDKIIEYNIPRINVSIHTTDPGLRVKMMNHKNAGNVMQIMREFADNNINMNGQIVLCPGYNDGAALDRTLADLWTIRNAIESVSVVPVGLTAHRDGLCDLKPYGKESALAVIKQVKTWQERFMDEMGSNFVYLADEFYLAASVKVPEFDHYEGFPQIENGVGLIASLKDEFNNAIGAMNNRPRKIKVKTRKSVVTGELAFDFITGLVKKLNSDKINVHGIKNHFFGGGVTVAGLVTGRDILDQLRGEELGKYLLIPRCMLRDGLFLDDTSIADIERKLKTKVVVVENDGYEFLKELLS